MKQSRRRFRIWHIPIILVGVMALLLLYYYVTSLFLHVERYTLEVDVSKPVRIVHLSDLHNAEFGANNRKLVRMVAEQEPDLIFMSGDMLNGYDSGTDIVTQLITDLSLVAPVYFGYGNHEKNWERNYQQDLRSIMEDAGAIVVDNDYVDLEVKGNSLRIGGYMGYYQAPRMTSMDKEQWETEFAFFSDFEDIDRLKLLINHIPTSWVKWHCVDKYPVDVVFSGHYHGGVIRIPILDQGVYAPYVGWFPPFTRGVYSGSMATCVLSAGLGTEHFIPRINNPPEIVVVDLISHAE